MATMELDMTMVRATFPEWRIGGSPGRYFAVRDGIEVRFGPRSLVRRCLSAPDLAQLVGKLGLQEYLDSLNSEELADVWQRVTLPLSEAPATS